MMTAVLNGEASVRIGNAKSRLSAELDQSPRSTRPPWRRPSPMRLLAKSECP